MVGGGVSREGRTGARITKEHLESVFIATGQKVPGAKLDDLLPLAQEAIRWDCNALQFTAQMMWNEERQAWGFFTQQAAATGQ